MQMFLKKIEEQTGGRISMENAWYPLSTIVEFGRVVAYLADVEPIYEKTRKAHGNVYKTFNARRLGKY